MHDYAIFGHNRATIGRWLGIISIVLAGAASSLFAWLYEATSAETYVAAIVTPAIIYFILHCCFNKFAWKLLSFSIPNVSGVWSVQGKTLNEDGSVIPPFSTVLICRI